MSLFRKITLLLAIISIFLFSYRLMNENFNPLPNFIFYFLPVVFLLFGFENVKAKHRSEGFIYLLTFVIGFSIVIRDLFNLI
ncbi:hypothetical protein SAMN05216353_101273 [Halobacillus alkaliphilus]|uniref:DUF3953 domain-containing protein n=1 Tax=Halobacillus alkaliphilus TaxID=396056 RepID=A0A1I2JRB3_9BACI|nr:hypothetical protein SAMN05216353_101273 [Halobacillus alkaliphilus]